MTAMPSALRTTGFVLCLLAGIFLLGAAVVTALDNEQDAPVALVAAVSGCGVMLGAVAFGVAGNLMDRTPRAPQHYAAPPAPAPAPPQAPHGPGGVHPSGYHHQRP
jgi:hypothetical protein